MPEWLVSLIASLISSGIVAALFERRLKIAEAKLKEAEAGKTHAGAEQTHAEISAAQNAEWKRLYDLQATETQQAQADVTALRTTIEHEHKRAAVREDELYTEIASLREELASLQKVHAENVTLQNENQTLKEQVNKLRAEVSQLRDENAELREKLAALTKRLTELEVKTGPFKKGKPDTSVS